MTLSMRLETINGVLRWTGFRLYVATWDGKGGPVDTRVGVIWWGSPFERRWPGQRWRTETTRGGRHGGAQEGD